MPKRPFLAVDIDGAALHCAAIKHTTPDWVTYQTIALDPQIEDCLRGVEAALSAAGAGARKVSGSKAFNRVSAGRGRRRELALSLPDWLFQHGRVDLPAELSPKNRQAQLQAECEVRFGTDALFTALPAQLSLAVPETGSAAGQQAVHKQSYDLIALPKSAYLAWQTLLSDQLRANIVSLEPRSWAIQRAGHAVLDSLPSQPSARHASRRPSRSVITDLTNMTVLLVDAEQALLLTVVAGRIHRAVIHGGFGRSVPNEDGLVTVDQVHIRQAAVEDLMRNLMRQMRQMPSSACDVSDNCQEQVLYCVADDATFTALQPHFAKLGMDVVMQVKSSYELQWCPALLGLARIGVDG